VRLDHLLSKESPGKGGRQHEKRIQRTLSFTLVGYRGLHEDLDS